MSQAEIVIFGTSHVGLRLAQRLTTNGQRVRVVDRPAEAPETPEGWEYTSGNFTSPTQLACARMVFIVTDEDKLNIRTALAVRSAYPDLPIVITLVQSRLGKKLARHLDHFSFISPSELAADKFVDAVYAPAPDIASAHKPSEVAPEPDLRKAWNLDPLVLRAVIFFATLALFTTVYFHFAEGLSWVDAWYFVVTLMTTVGFGDISLRTASTTSKIIGTLLMIASVTNTAIIFALITDSLLRRRIVLSFGRKRVKQSDHVLVVGMGAVGLKVVEELLERGERVTVIEDDANGRFMPTIYALRVPTIIGDAKLERTLRDAGLPNAKALLSVTSDDLTNLEIGLNAKSLSPNTRVVLRIYDYVLAQALYERLEIHFAFSASAIAAEELAKMVKGSDRNDGSYE
ncbi:MAG TPA: NAD-binding protein [Blastocatellia bacterium]|nr:NAD-binding protein [Blastocatellia bacterium]